MQSVDATLDMVVQEAWVKDVLSEVSIVVAVGDKDVIVELLHPARFEPEVHEEDGDGDTDRKDAKIDKNFPTAD